MLAQRAEVAVVAIEMSTMHCSADEQYGQAVLAAHNVLSVTTVGRARV